MRSSLVIVLGAAALCCSASAAPTPPPFERVIFSEEFANATGARCLDGSPSGFYIRQQQSKSVAIFLQGGGACYTNEGSSNTNCAVRAKSALGSSTYWSSTFDDTDNVLSADPSVNPLFATWTHVFVPYCSGDVHVGTRQAVVNASFPFYFSGHLTVMAVVEALKNSSAIDASSASDVSVFLAGSSAGGIGTFMNADAIGAALPKGVASYKAGPQGGWFFPFVVAFPEWQAGVLGPPYAGENVAIDDLWDSFLNPACVAAYNRSYCGTITNAYPFIKTPLHVAENLEDSNQIFAQLLAPQTTAADAFISPYFQKAMTSALGQVLGTANGLWAPACLLHTENLNLVSSTRVNGVSLVEGLAAWYAGAGAANGSQIDACVGVGCNPTCAA